MTPLQYGYSIRAVNCSLGLVSQGPNLEFYQQNLDSVSLIKGSQPARKK